MYQRVVSTQFCTLVFVLDHVQVQHNGSFDRVLWRDSLSDKIAALLRQISVDSRLNRRKLCALVVMKEQQTRLYPHHKRTVYSLLLGAH